MLKFPKTANYSLHPEKQPGFTSNILLFIDISSFVGKYHEIFGSGFDNNGFGRTALGNPETGLFQSSGDNIHQGHGFFAPFLETENLRTFLYTYSRCVAF
jgi:hypothetical protein